MIYYNDEKYEGKEGINFMRMNSLAVKKKIGENNPIIAQRFMADPYAIEYEGRIYVYGSNDSDSLYKDENGNYYRNEYGNIKSLNCISSDDLVNWTDHGVIQVAKDERKGVEGISKWASNSWAPAVCYNTVVDEKTGEEKVKFFLYFANSANNIGVLTADSPIGPWSDPLGKPIISREDAGIDGVEWLFDPAVLVDDNGEAYIYFGGGVPRGKEVNPQTGRVAKLGKDMISIDGEAILLDAPYLFEDSGIHKIGDTYYYSYCSNWSEEAANAMGKAQISYMTSKNPMGPFEYQGEIMKNPGQSEYFSPEAWGNNHHCVLAYKDLYYMFYHTPQYEKDVNVKLEDAPNKCAYRTSYVDVVTVDEDGKNHVDNMTRTGTAKQLKALNPYKTVDAATFAWADNVITDEKKQDKQPGKCEMDMCLCTAADECFVGLSKVDFEKEGCSGFAFKAASTKDCTMKVYVDEMTEANLISELSVAATGSEDNFKEFDAEVKKISGEHNLFIVFEGEDIAEKVFVDSWVFKK